MIQIKNMPTYSITILRNIMLCLMLPILALAMSVPPVHAAEVIWYDGKKAPLPRGSLLTNNRSYWGERIPTDVTYSYPDQPDNPPDTKENKEGSAFGNRLLDGQRGGDWTSPVGVTSRPLIVDFDFKQAVTLNDIAVAEYQGRDLQLAEVEVKSDSDAPWKNVYASKSSQGPLHHILLASPATARYVRIRVQSAGNITHISQVWMWGKGRAVVKKPAHGFWPAIRKFKPTKKAKPGDGTILTPGKLSAWRRTTGFHEKGLTWQVDNSWSMLKKDYLKGNFLPGKDALRQPVKLTATREENTSGVLHLVNASDKPQEVTVQLSAFRDEQGRTATGLKSDLYVAGSIWTRRWGQALRPLFSAVNKLAPDQMEEYLTNGGTIKDFPVLHLPARGTALLWVAAELRGAAPGLYSATISAGSQEIPVSLKVYPVVLPTPKRWLYFYNTEPAAHLGLWSDDEAVEREVEYQQSLGNTVWPAWPTDNNYTAMARRLLENKGERRFQLNIILNEEVYYGGSGAKIDPGKFDDGFKKRVRDDVLKHVEQAKKLGLSYEDWSLQLWDEPYLPNMKIWVAIARLVKEVDPKVQLYCNILFWTPQGTNPGGLVTDERQVEAMEGWYNDLVDISVPLQYQADPKAYPEANSRFYNHLPRKVRAYYTHPNPGRSLSWEAFIRDYDGWASYAYYAPRKDAWDDFDHPEHDYNIVYPGPKGFVPTTESESMRESWQDYRLLTLLQQQGKEDVLKKITDLYKMGVGRITRKENPELRDRRCFKANEKLPCLRQMALEAALQ